MKTKSNLKKIDNFRSNQELLRKKAIKSGVNLIAPETIFLSKVIKFGKNVKVNPYVVIGNQVKIGKNVEILSSMLAAPFLIVIANWTIKNWAANDLSLIHI